MGKIIFAPILRYVETENGLQILPYLESYFENIDKHNYSDIIFFFPNEDFKESSKYRSNDYLSSLVKSNKINVKFLNKEMSLYYDYVKGLYIENLPGHHYPNHSERSEKIKEIILDPLINTLDLIEGDKDVLVIVLSTGFFKNGKKFGMFSYFFYFLYVFYGDRSFNYLINYKNSLKKCDQSFYKKLTFKGHSQKDESVYWLNNYYSNDSDVENYMDNSGFSNDELDQMYRDAYDNDPNNQWNND